MDLSKYKIKQLIGKGGFGEVFLIEDQETKKNYAAKISIKECTNQIEIEKFLSKCNILSKVKFPTILQFYGYNLKNFNFEPYPTVITDFMPKRSLRELLDQIHHARAPSDFSDTKKYIILFGIAIGMKYLHAKNIIHHNIKPDNILLDNNYYPRIYNFGNSKMTAKDLKNQMTKSELDNTLYIAPEIISNDQYTYKIDIYSFSIIAYEIITGQSSPFNISLIQGEENQQFFRKIHSKDPSERPDFTEICKFIIKQSFVNIFGFIDYDELHNFFDYLTEEDPDTQYYEYELLFDKDIENEKDDKGFEVKKRETKDEKTKICYNLFIKTSEAEIIQSQEAKGNVLIPTYVDFHIRRFLVTKINDESFSNSQLNSLTFSEDSKIRYIGKEAFKNSDVSRIFIPASIVEIDEDAFNGAEKLNRIDVDQNNDHFSIENSCLIYESNEKVGIENRSLKEVVFAPRNFSGEFSIPNGLTRIRKSSFSTRNGIQSLKSETPTLMKIDPKSFYKCENLKNFVVKNCSRLNIGSSCFCEATNLCNVSIKSDELIIEENCFENCSSISSILFSEIDKITIKPRSFIGCTKLESITIKSKSSIEIGEKCFFNANKLKSIGFISKSISIDKDFINGCSSLTFFLIKSEESIDLYPTIFDNCSCLKTVKISTQKTLKLFENCFHSSAKLESIELTGKFVDIPLDCFKDCPTLELISVETDQDLNLSALFSECKFLKDLKIFSKSSIFIRKEFMKEAARLESIELSARNISISDECFMNCLSLSVFTIKKSGNIQIGTNQFAGCNRLQKICIEQDLVIESENGPITQLDSNCFNGAVKLKEITFTGGNLRITDGILKNCSSLEILSIEKAERVFIDKNQFCNFRSLKRVNIESNTSLVLKSRCFMNSSCLETVNLSSKSIEINHRSFERCTSLALFKVSKSGSVYFHGNQFGQCNNLYMISVESTIESQPGVASKITFGPNSFSGATNLKKVIFSGGDVLVNKNCFQNCQSLLSVFFNSQSVTIEKGQLSNLSSLKNISIEADSRIVLNSYCFSDCCKLEAAIISGKEVYTSDNCFFNCSSLKDINFSKIERIDLGQSLFDYCKKIVQINFDCVSKLKICKDCFLGSNVKDIFLKGEFIEIESDCFRNNSYITSLSIESKKDVVLGKDAFNSCNYLENIFICASSKLSIGASCFAENRSLKTIRINCGEVKTGNYCFASCNSVISLVINTSGNVDLGDNSFERCSRLETVEINGKTEINIGNSCFSNAKLKSAIINAQKVNIYELSFENCSSLESFNSQSFDTINYTMNSFKGTPDNLKFNLESCI